MTQKIIKDVLQLELKKTDDSIQIKNNEISIFFKNLNGLKEKEDFLSSELHKTQKILKDQESLLFKAQTSLEELEDYKDALILISSKLIKYEDDMEAVSETIQFFKSINDLKNHKTVYLYLIEEIKNVFRGFEKDKELKTHDILKSLSDRGCKVSLKRLTLISLVKSFPAIFKIRSVKTGSNTSCVFISYLG